MRHEFPFVWFLVAFAAYTALLFIISWITARKAGSSSFFSGDKKAPWPVIAYGMVGASISGVTFISVPGNVLAQNFYYMPLVLGFVGGYIIIAKVLLPLYYRMNLTSIYTYLGERFGTKSYKTGTSVFMVSRILGAAVRIFVVVVVFFAFIPKGMIAGTSDIVVFAIVTFIFLVLLYFYTFKGGVKTIIWTDVLQTTFMLLAVFLTIFYVCRDMGWSFSGMASAVASAENPQIPGTSFSDMFDWNWGHGTNAIKQFIAGIFITIAMTGLDQTMMQKNLACKDIKAAQKNMYTTSIIIVVVNFFFLLLGALLSIYVANKGGFDALGITKTDEMFPTIASQYLGVGVGILFLIGLISASYPSAGGALTSLTTSFCVDFIGFNNRSDLTVERKEKMRKWIHAGFAFLFFIIILVLFIVSNDAVVNLVYKLASYTYGPLLGLFFFGILTKYKIKDGATPYIAVGAPLLCLIINLIGKKYLGFDLGFTLLIVNGAITFLALWLCRIKPSAK
ncbi:MAG: sodium:solute symporter [Bacteroidales bacterium]|nr:sodium:solute symporter [Bacteroidales bacterium]MDD4670634.1 sodium:solute symporter [Bacteroidales bacterium]